MNLFVSTRLVATTNKNNIYIYIYIFQTFGTWMVWNNIKFVVPQKKCKMSKRRWSRCCKLLKHISLKKLTCKWSPTTIVKEFTLPSEMFPRQMWKTHRMLSCIIRVPLSKSHKNRFCDLQFKMLKINLRFPSKPNIEKDITILLSQWMVFGTVNATAAPMHFRNVHACWTIILFILSTVGIRILSLKNGDNVPWAAERSLQPIHVFDHMVGSEYSMWRLAHFGYRANKKHKWRRMTMSDDEQCRNEWRQNQWRK